jgi:formylmethanofuran dehydrogenase subunit E
MNAFHRRVSLALSVVMLVVLSVASAVSLSACASAPAAASTPALASAPAPASASASSADPTEKALDDVANIHGAPGPWAVAGYRMGVYALGKLGVSRGSFDLEVVHHTPRAVKFSCIADGAQASTGASAGKLNLAVVDADEAHVATTYRRKSTGQSITLRPTASFAERFRDFPRDQARVLGKQVLELPAPEVFEEIPTPSPSP